MESACVLKRPGARNMAHPGQENRQKAGTLVLLILHPKQTASDSTALAKRPDLPYDFIAP